MGDGMSYNSSASNLQEGEVRTWDIDGRNKRWKINPRGQLHTGVLVSRTRQARRNIHPRGQLHTCVLVSRTWRAPCIPQ